MATYTTAFESWKSARSHLEHALQGYIDASVALHDALSVPSSSITSSWSREQALIKLDHELTSLTSYESTLQKAKYRLCLARNTSCAISPISSLPSDVLYAILVQASRPNRNSHSTKTQRSYEAQVTTLSSVCSAWRHLMTQSPVFWTSITIGLNHDRSESELQLGRLWSERCMKIDLDLIRLERERGSNPPWRNVKRAVVLDLLAAVMRCVRTLKIRTDSESGVQLLLSFWVAHGTLGRATSLIVHVQSSMGVVGVLRDAFGETAGMYPNTFANFFGSLRRLVFRNVWVGWPELMHAGLVEFQLTDIHGWTPTLQDLVKVLKATPRLRALSVLGVHIASNPSEFDTVALDELQVLRLDRWELLGAITSTSESIELCMHGLDRPITSAARSFLDGAKVMRLYTDLKHSLHVDTFSIPKRHLRALAVENLPLRSDHSRVAVQSISANMWPELREIHLINCIANPEMLRQYMMRHPARTLIWHWSFSFLPDEPNILTDLKSVETALLGTGIVVASIKEGEDSPAGSWPYKFRSQPETSTFFLP